jgi:hypothetical protein
MEFFDLSHFFTVVRDKLEPIHPTYMGLRWDDLEKEINQISKESTAFKKIKDIVDDSRSA